MSEAKPVRACRYLRVSRSDQDPALQHDATAKLIEARGWTLVETFIDHGVSGAKARRPELNRLLERAKRGDFDVLVVYRSDRLFRSLPNMVTTLADLAALGVAFVSVTEPFDTSTPTGKLMLHLVAAFAQFERDVLIARTIDGMQAARRRGARIGRPPVVVDVGEARRLRAQGVPMRKIAARLGCGMSTIRRALRQDAALIVGELSQPHYAA